MLTGSYGQFTHTGAFKALSIYEDWDLWFIIEGVAIWRLGDGQTLRAGKDEFLLLPPKTLADMQYPASSLRHWFCHFDFRPIPAKVFQSVRRDCLGDEGKLLIPLRFTRKEAPDVWQAFRDFIEVGNRNLLEPGPPWRVETALIRLVSAMAVFARRLGLRADDVRLIDATTNMDPRLLRLCQEIRARPAMSWRVAALAARVDMSPRQLERLCRTQLRRSLRSYIMEIRLSRALQLLSAATGVGRQTIKEISHTCGFASARLFTYAFKKYYRATPTRYCRRARHLWEMGAT